MPNPEAALRARTLIDRARAALEEAAEVLRTLDDDDRRSAGLQWEYHLLAVGDPRGPVGTRPIFSTSDSDRLRARAQVGAAHARTHDPDYREEMRRALRAKRMPEPMIWDRWPALNAFDRADRDSRLRAWQGAPKAAPKAPAAPPLDPFDAFLVAYARRESNRTNASQQGLLADPAFVEAVRERFDLFQTLSRPL